MEEKKNTEDLPDEPESKKNTEDLPDEPESEVAEADEPEYDDGSNAVELRTLSDEEFFNEIMEHFNDYDAERDESSGTIPAEYLGTLLDILTSEGIIEPVDDDELEMLRNDMDADGNGLISAEEFKDVLDRRRRGEDFSDEELKEAFGVFDHHSRGYITPMELRQAMKAIFDVDVPALDANSMVMAASRTGGDRIDLEEFMGIIRWKRQCL
jgi:calmodulin